MSAYEIRVRGVMGREIGEQVAADAHVDHETVLRGPLDDQSTLYDLVDRLYALGLELVDVRQSAYDDDQPL